MELNHSNNSSHTAHSTQHFSRFMLALILSCALGVTQAHAQSNTEYSFRQQSVADGQGFNSNGDPVPVLTMDCLAANGYGQWTLSSQAGQGGDGSGATSYPVGWYLLANGLYAPSTHFSASDLSHFPECIPPGVVQNGTMAGGVTVAETKATANLDGAENFVWPDQAGGTLHQDFIVQGFRSSNVDLSLSFLSNPVPPMDLIPPPPSPPAPPGTLAIANSYPMVSTLSGGVFHNIVASGTTQAPTFPDEFDVCSDASYLYITWCSTTNLSHGILGSEVWATVVDINTFVVQAGFPMSLGQGERPTVACDPRDNRGVATPWFEVAYLTGHTSPSSIKRAFWNGMSLSVITLANQFIPPTCGLPWGYTYVTHARMLVSSVNGEPATDAVYAIVDQDVHAAHKAKGAITAGSPQTTTLIEYTPVLPGTSANFVDGIYIAPELPVPASTGTYPGWPIVDKPIVAISNPYDEQDYPGVPFNQFHCLYQCNQSDIGRLPMMIVQGDDNGSCTTTDERLVMNQVFPVPPTAALLPDDPATYCAAVNQMGIHVHWRTIEGVHFYSRDLNRTFDEDIDENTLVTDQCTVSDGSGHGGSVGSATVWVDNNSWNRQISVWTDPNYGPPSLDGTSGLYSPRLLGTHTEPVGRLQFVGDNVLLSVQGDLIGGEIATLSHATLAVMPFFYFDFLGSGQGVKCGSGSTFDYYGLYATHDGTGTQTAISTPFTDGTGDGVGGGTIDLEGSSEFPSFLNVHGGADFFTGPSGNLTSNIGTINVDFESAVYPVTSGTANPSATGHMTLQGFTSLNASTITGAFPSETPGGTYPLVRHVIATVEPSPIAGHPSPSPQFSSTYNLYQNDPQEGLSELLFSGNTSSIAYGTSSFSNDNFNAGQLVIQNPQNNFSVEDCSFDHSKDASMWFTLDPSFTTYGTCYISGNTFGEITRVSSLANPVQIEFDDFFTQHRANIDVVNNVMTTNNGQGNLDGAIGIYFSSTDGVAEGNSITASKYQFGLAAAGAEPGYGNQNTSLICSNTLKNAWNVNLFTYGYTGYVKLNEIASGAEYGWQHGGGATGNGIFNYIHDCQYSGILIANNTSTILDLSGVHYDPINHSPGDYAAYDTIKNNNQANGSSYGQIELIYANQQVWVGKKPGSSYTVFGEDNIEQGTSTSSNLIKGANNTTTLDISNNYWGGADPTSLTPPPDWPNFNYSATSVLGGESGITGITCGSSDITKRISSQPLSIEKQQNVDSCQLLDLIVSWYINQENFDTAYDTGRYFVLHCPGNPRAFSDFGGTFAASQVQTIQGKLALRQFLLNLLPAATAGGNFCSCVGDLIYTFTGTDPELNDKIQLSIIKFLLDQQACQGNNDGYAFDYQNARRDQIIHWIDTAKMDSMQYFDSTLFSMHDLGLDSVLKYAGLLGVKDGKESIVSNGSAYPNPTGEGTILSFGTSKEAYVLIELFDVLGHKMETAHFESVLQPGNHEVPIPLQGLPSGTYYARIQTTYGEAQTVKLVKE
ncbi:MAG TPA: T9SS type A sorting domain-containing protein [Candidatus Kapabacteria bacterium]|nr:T9SS type A sorting domain-containing protein [Candidatus Kapabacteria bacterium]